MKIHAGQGDFTELWNGVLYKVLTRYPDVTGWEMRNMTDFIRYEKDHGRSCEIEADDPDVCRMICREAQMVDKYRNVPPPDKIVECTACRHGGCMTKCVCHTAPVESTLKILACGELQSATVSRNMSGALLRKEPRNAAGDPADFFEYVMFAWGNCQAGDRLIIERTLGRMPTEEDLRAHFTPGVRFYASYESIMRHPMAVSDGVHPVKVKERVALEEWISAIAVPEIYRAQISPAVPKNLRKRVHYIESRDCADVWAWAEKVYGEMERYV